MDTPEFGALVSDEQKETKSGVATAEVSADAQGNPQNPLITLEMDEASAAEWFKRIKLSDDRVSKEAEAWKTLLDAYLPKVKKAGTAEDVNANSHFRNVHTKLGQMFVAVPEIRLQPSPSSPAENVQPGPPGPMGQPVSLSMSDIVIVKQEILNKKLGRDGIRVNRLFDRIIFDQLGFSGLGCSKLGYRCVKIPVQQPVMGPDPTWQPQAPPPGTIMGLQPPQQPPQVPQMDPMTGQPQMQTVEVPIFDEIYWDYIPSMKIVIDSTCYSTDYDRDAGFLGHHFSMMPSQAAAAFGLEEDDLSTGTDDLRYKHKNDEDSGPVMITGVELFYKAALFYPGEMHPQKLHQVVFLDHKKDAPVVHRPYEDQEFTETGELTDTSVDKFPIRICTIRDLTDSAFPPSDSAFTNNLAKQLNTNRQQGVALRDAAIGKVLFDGGKLEDGDVMKVRNARPGDWIEVADGALDKGKDSVATTVAQPTRTNDDYRLDAMLQHNMDETLGISANSAGGSEDTVRSATEIQTIQRAVQGRNQKEQGRVIDHFLDGVRLIDILVMRYTTGNQWVKITGDEGAQKMMMWNAKMVAGKYVYDIAPDSQLAADTAQDRQMNLNFYNLVAKDPLVNRAPILQRLARQFGYDPNKVIINPAMMQMQPPHGGEVSKHEGAKSGGTENAPGAANQSEAQP